jgi:hypothetical protein
VGVEVTRVLTALALAVAVVTCGSAAAEEHYALVVTGAPGGPEFRTNYQTWEQQLKTALRDKLGFAPDHIELLSGGSDDPERSSTRQNVQRSLERLKARLRPGDMVFLVLMGHGTLDGGIAKFNLPGPDLSSVEWGTLLRDIPGRLVVVDTTGASFPFLTDLAARGHIVITATDSAAQRYDTVFPAQFLTALTDPAADLDKNGRVSVWELFLYSSRAVARHYEQQGLLPTERALLDDSGDGIGVDATTPSSTDGALARATYLERDRLETSGDAEMAALIARRHALEERAEQLRQKKATLAPEAWEREFEQLMIELARVSHRIRAGS